jgi:hypothetical protein
VVIAVREALQEYERDEEQRNDKMDSVHERERECSIAESNFLSGLLLWEQTGKPLRLEDDKGDANDEKEEAQSEIASSLQKSVQRFLGHGRPHRISPEITSGLNYERVLSIIPAQAGTQRISQRSAKNWVPACAGMT